MKRQFAAALCATVFELVAAQADDFGGRLLVVEGLTHEEHTTDADGNFKHPYLDESPELATIHYPESSTFSVKLNRHSAQAGDSLAIGKDRSSLVINPDADLYSHDEDNESFLGRFSDLFEPAGAAKDQRKTLTNQLNIWYSGTIYMGTPYQTLTKFMFDNAYNYNLIEYDGCTSGCSGTTFDSTKSSTYKKGTNPTPLPSSLSNV